MAVFKHTDSVGRQWARRVLAIVLLVGLAAPGVPTSYGQKAVAPPTLLEPDDGVHTTGNPADPDTTRVLYEPLGLPLFRWEAVPGATQYCFEINNEPDFSGFKAVDRTASTKLLSYTAYSPPFDDWKTYIEDSIRIIHPLEDHTYYWRVGSWDPESKFCQWSETRSFTRHWGMVAEPVAPPDAGPNDYHEFTPVFEWKPVEGASFYEIQISSDPSFGTIEIDWYTRQTMFAPYYLPRLASQIGPLANDREYYWRVRPMSYANNGLNGNGGAAGNWNCNAGPTTDCWKVRVQWSYYHGDTKTDRRPVPLTPVNHATNVSVPLFSWTPVEGASSYELEVCNDPGCLSRVFRVGASPSDYLPTPNNAWTYRLGYYWGLVPNKTYYWRVRACQVYCRSDQVGQWTDQDPSRLFQFTTGPLTPTTPSLFYPSYYYTPTVNQGDFEDRTIAVPVFMWDHVYNAITYTLQVADPVTDPGFASPLWQVQTRNLNAVPTSTTVLDHGIFAWRVSADGGATWSQIWKTRIDTARLSGATSPAQPPRLLRPTYRQEPDGNIYGYESVDTFPLLEWLPVQGASKYHVQIALDPGFADVVHEADTLFTDYAPLDYCPPTYGAPGSCRMGWGTYYWRVRALGAGGTPLAGGYSTPYRFIVSKPLRFILGHTADQVGPFDDRALLAPDSLADAADPTRELGNVYVGVDRHNWLIGFEATPGATPVTYTILLDSNHADGNGALHPPGASGLTTTLPHRPDYAIVASFNSATTTFTPTLYTWQRVSQSWDVGRQFWLVNSTARYDAAAQLAELRLSRTALQLYDPGANPASIAFSLFSTSSGGAVADAVPDNPSSTYLSRFVANSQAPSPVLPPAQVITGNAVMRQTPVMMWRTMDDVQNARQGVYAGRVARDYGFATIYQPLPSIPDSIQKGLMPGVSSIMNLTASTAYYIPYRYTYEDNASYFWSVASVVFDGPRTAANVVQLPYSQPGEFSKSMFSPVDLAVSPVTVSGTMTYTTQTPVFRWKAAQGATGYLLTIKQGGTSEWLAQTTFHTVHAPINSLAPGYYTWQVQAFDYMCYVNQYVGFYGPVIAGPGGGFTVAYPKVDPDSVHPKSGESLGDPLIFSWDKVKGAAHYEIEVDLTDQFSSKYLNRYRTFNTVFVPPSAPAALGKGGELYWRVRMCNGDNNCGAWTLTLLEQGVVYLPLLLKKA